jgi:hypothetical protein
MSMSDSKNRLLERKRKALPDHVGGKVSLVSILIFPAVKAKFLQIRKKSELFGRILLRLRNESKTIGLTRNRTGVARMSYINVMLMSIRTGSDNRYTIKPFLDGLLRPHTIMLPSNATSNQTMVLHQTKTTDYIGGRSYWS